MKFSPDVISDADPALVEDGFELDPDVDNAIYDLLVQDEEFAAAASRCFEDLQHMMMRLSGLDEAHSAFEPLVEILNSRTFRETPGQPNLEDLAAASGYKYHRGLQAVESLNQHRFMSKPEWLLAAGGIAVSAVTGVPVGSAAAGAVVGKNTGDAWAEVRKTRQALELYLDFTASLHSCREEFDAAYDRLVLQEDSEPDDAAEL